jgi:hypothetical protein
LRSAHRRNVGERASKKIQILGKLAGNFLLSATLYIMQNYLYQFVYFFHFPRLLNSRQNFHRHLSVISHPGILAATRKIYFLPIFTLPRFLPHEIYGLAFQTGSQVVSCRVASLPSSTSTAGDGSQPTRQANLLKV